MNIYECRTCSYRSTHSEDFHEVQVYYRHPSAMDPVSDGGYTLICESCVKADSAKPKTLRRGYMIVADRATASPLYHMVKVMRD